MKKGLFVCVVVLVLGGIIFTNYVKGSEPKKGERSIHILAGIDSLTNGRLYAKNSNRNRYLEYFIPVLKGKYGDGGPGYVPFDSRYFNQEGGILRYTNGLKEINDLPHTAFPAPYSFDFKGIYTNAGNGGGRITVRLKNSWQSVKLFYLKQPGGGTFETGFVNGKTQTVNTNGKMGLGVINLSAQKNQKQLQIRKIEGKVVLFGGYFYNHSGIVVSRVGQGGDRLAWYAGLNQQQLGEWIKALEPDLFIFNGGMNDRNHLSGSQYEQTLNRYLNPFLKTECPLILTIPNAILGNQRQLDDYEIKLRHFAKAHGTGLVSNRKVLGDTFQTANKNRYMIDAIHPNKKGSILISKNLLKYISDHEDTLFEK